MAVSSGSAPSLTLADLDVGTAVKVGNDRYILCIKWTATASMLREDVLPTSMKMQNSSSVAADYDGSIVDDYLTNTYVPSLPSSVTKYMSTGNFTINVADVGAASTTTKTIQRKIIVPQYSMMADTGSLTTVLKAYYETTNANTARIAKSNGTAVEYWLCDAWTNGTQRNMHTVMNTGGRYRRGQDNSYYVRPYIYMQMATPVKIVNDEYVLGD